MIKPKLFAGARKRQQIESTKNQVLIWVAVAACAMTVCLLIGNNLVQRINYQNKVNGELAKTEKIMHDNIQSINDLKSSINAMQTNKQLNLVNLKEDDSTVYQVVLDALPTEDDRAALGSSLQKKVLYRSGVNIEQISVVDDAVALGSSNMQSDGGAESTVYPKAKEISFTITVGGTFQTIQEVLKDIELTIRPVVVSSVNIEGSDDKLLATIRAITYYSPKVNWQMGSKGVNP